MNNKPLPSEQAAARVRWLAPTTLGTLYCGLSALAYGLMGICQRQVATSCDPVVVNCVQASVSTTTFGAYLLFRSLRGQSDWPPLREMVALVGIGIVTQLGGVAYQWSIGIIGLAIANPLQMGGMLAGSAVLGFLLLGEEASWRCITAMADHFHQRGPVAL
jgi:drug/metabolite transporter (DMT)-like permease